MSQNMSYIAFRDHYIGPRALVEFIWILSEVYPEGKITVIHLYYYHRLQSSPYVIVDRVKFVRVTKGPRPFDVYCFVCGDTESCNVFGAIEFYRMHKKRHG